MNKINLIRKLFNFSITSSEIPAARSDQHFPFRTSPLPCERRELHDQLPILRRKLQNPCIKLLLFTKLSELFFLATVNN
jgi:hypothetical protein